ncbi:hypothetical protein FSS13T_11160 [Flavobacterium saliperosum S13]|uniref:Uncharacterized protein n=1 Tax=Flavobacterium saliperosum S13 TaxID=1341155 RepID=A0ABP2ZXE4_9FLAO|nr:hypothetical protein FSS13T_11160 [Flavobacterium saliperosum S13]
MLEASKIRKRSSWPSAPGNETIMFDFKELTPLLGECTTAFFNPLRSKSNRFLVGRIAPLWVVTTLLFFEEAFQNESPLCAKVLLVNANKAIESNLYFMVFWLLIDFWLLVFQRKYI